MEYRITQLSKYFDRKCQKAKSELSKWWKVTGINDGYERLREIIFYKTCKFWKNIYFGEKYFVMKKFRFLHIFIAIVAVLYGVYWAANKAASSADLSFTNKAIRDVKEVLVYTIGEFSDQCQYNTKTISFERQVLTKNECEMIKNRQKEMFQYNPSTYDVQKANATLSIIQWAAWDPNMIYNWTYNTVSNYWLIYEEFLWHFLIIWIFSPIIYWIQKKNFQKPEKDLLPTKD